MSGDHTCVYFLLHLHEKRKDVLVCRMSRYDCSDKHRSVEKNSHGRTCCIKSAMRRSCSCCTNSMRSSTGCASTTRIPSLSNTFGTASGDDESDGRRTSGTGGASPSINRINSERLIRHSLPIFTPRKSPRSSMFVIVRRVTCKTAAACSEVNTRGRSLHCEIRKLFIFNTPEFTKTINTFILPQKTISINGFNNSVFYLGSIG